MDFQFQKFDDTPLVFSPTPMPEIRPAPAGPNGDEEVRIPSLEERIEEATESIYDLFDLGHVCYVAFSGGKDSSVVADLVLNAARKYSEIGIRKPVVAILHGNTLVENPEVREHCDKDLKRMQEYAAKHGFDLHVRVATPSMASTWQLKILSGRGLPSFAGQNTDCSVDLKITPQQRVRKALNKQFEAAGYDEPVVCLGTRFDESVRRSARMASRGENAYEAVRNKDGELILSPICDWTTDEVFEYLGTRQGTESYSDFKDTLRVYAHAEGQSCAVVAATIESGKQKKGGCGARHGCFVCQQATDKSLENMIAHDERYAYARGLNQLNKFIRNTRHDWNRRHWVGRTIKGGYVEIRPDTYHPSMVRELFRYMAQIQYDEQVRARAAGEAPKFMLLTDEMVALVDATWSLNGLARPFTAWMDLMDIYSGQVRYDIPDIEPFPDTPMPASRFLYVGEEWDDTASGMSALTGLRDSYIEALTEGSGCQPDLRETAGGHMIWDVDTSDEFGINTESLMMIEDFELNDMVERARHEQDQGLPGGITYGYKWYLQYGALEITPGQRAKHDEILRRTAYKDRLGLTLDYSIEDLLARSVSFDELPDAAKEAWAARAPKASKAVAKSERMQVESELKLAARAPAMRQAG